MRRQRRTSVGRMETNKLKRSAEQRARDTHKQVQKLLSSVTGRVREAQSDYTVDDALAELDDAMRLAFMTASPGAAVSAIMGKCKLMGLIIDRSAQMVGKPGDFAEPQTIDGYIEDMRETLGSRGVQRFIELLNGMGIAYRGEDGVIDGEAEED
jgi:hypothetical protein